MYYIVILKRGDGTTRLPGSSFLPCQREHKCWLCVSYRT